MTNPGGVCIILLQLSVDGSVRIGEAAGMCQLPCAISMWWSCCIYCFGPKFP